MLLAALPHLHALVVDLKLVVNLILLVLLLLLLALGSDLNVLLVLLVDGELAFLDSGLLLVFDFLVDALFVLLFLLALLGGLVAIFVITILVVAITILFLAVIRVPGIRILPIL